MIKRIVKLTFKAEFCNDFINFTKQIEDTISNFEGCEHLEILRDKKDSTVFFTCSFWKNEESLKNYRKSEFFNKIWPETKKWFAEKPEAWSTISII